MLPPPHEEHLGLEQRDKRFPFQQFVSQLTVVAEDVIQHTLWTPVSPARGPPTAWGELVQVHEDVEIAPDLTAHDRHPLALSPAVIHRKSS